MFILSNDGRDPADFDRYRRYLDSNVDRFPPRAYALARSAWYGNFRDHRCPHDGRLERLAVTDQATGPAWADRATHLSIRLRSAYDAGTITIDYDAIVRYDLGTVDLRRGHRDWRYDEFRLDDEGRLVHEIEWCGSSDTGRWLIVAADVEYRWDPDRRPPDDA